MPTPLHFSILIGAPRERVFSTMLDHGTYELWTSVFNPGSTYTGSWDLGSEIRFVGPDGTGCAGRITISRAPETVQVTFDGVICPDGSIVDGGFSGTTETYTFAAESPEVTQLTAELSGGSMSDEMREMFTDMWPRALEELKRLCET